MSIEYKWFRLFRSSESCESQKETLKLFTKTLINLELIRKIVALYSLVSFSSTS